MPDKSTSVLYDPEVKKILEKSSKTLALICLSLLLFIIVLIYALIVAIRFDKNVHLNATLLSNPIVENTLWSKTGYIINNKEKLDSSVVKRILFGNTGGRGLTIGQHLHKSNTSDGEKELLVYIRTGTSLIQIVPAFYKVSFNSYPLSTLDDINAQVIASKISNGKKNVELLLRIPAADLGIIKNYYYYNYDTSIDLTIGKQSFFDYMIHPYK